MWCSAIYRLCKHLGCSEAEGQPVIDEWLEGDGKQWAENSSGEVAPDSRTSSTFGTGQSPDILSQSSLVDIERDEEGAVLQAL